MRLDFPQKTDGLSNEEYHLRSELSCSNIKTLLENPYKYVQGIRPERTKSMDFGSAVHKLILEPHDFSKEFAVCPKVDLRTKVGKDTIVEFTKNSVGKIVLDKEEYERAVECSGIAKHIASAFFKDGVAEQSFFSEIDGIPVKCRPDYYIEDKNLIVDVKTTQDASPDGFLRSISKFGYYIQDAFYSDVLRSLGKQVDEFVFIAIETKPPYMVGIFTLGQTSRDFGRSEYQRAFDIYRRLDEFTEPAYKNTQSGEIWQVLELPSYVYYKQNASIS